MMLTGATLVAVTGIVKHIGPDLPAAEIAFLRYILGLVFLIPMIGPILRARMSRQSLFLFGARGLAHTCGAVLWFFAMTRISIAEVTALNYMAPIYVTIGAALFLGETLAFRRIIAVIAALVGVLIILRPGFREISAGHIAMLFTAIFFGISHLIAKLMSGRVSPAVVVGMLSITVTVGLAPFAYVNWVTPNFEQLAWIFLMASFATAGHFTMTLAFRAAPITVTQPATFLQLVWAVLLGAVVFGEAVDFWVVLGGSVILSSVIFIIWRETVLKRRDITPSHLETKI